MILNNIRFASVVILILQSPIVNAEYSAVIGQNEGTGYNELLYATEANQEAFTFSQTQSSLDYNYLIQPETGPVITTIMTSRVNATIKNSGVPYVSAQTYSRGNIGEGGGAPNRTDTNITSSLTYDLKINATPNTQIPIIMTSYYEMRFKNTPETYINNFAIGISSATVQVGLSANLNSSSNGNSLSFETSCDSTNIICSSRVTPQHVDESLKTNHLGNIEQGDYVIQTTAYRDKFYDLSNASVESNLYDEYFTKQNIVASFLIDVGTDGLINGGVNIFARSFSSAVSPYNFSESYAYIDPYFVIAPEYLALYPNTILSFNQGIGNDNPITSVPEPKTYSMFIACLVLLGFISRYKKSNKTQI